MLKEMSLEHILFLDIETAPQWAVYDECPEPFSSLWAKKVNYLPKEPGATPAELWPRSGIYAEFGKVICVSTAFYREGKIRVKSFAGHDERSLLFDFCSLLTSHCTDGRYVLCAHNGKEFDFPYLGRRVLINGLFLPNIIDHAGKKPWQVPHLDTMELWKFGDYKSYTSLELLAAVFNIPTPKNDIAGADVCRVYWEDGDLDRIVQYCQKDVVTLARIFQCYQGKLPTDDENIVFV